MTNPRNFLLNSDYPMDKILGWWSGSFAVSAYYGLFDPKATEYSFAHGVGDYGLILGSWSTDNTNWLPFGVTPADMSSGIPSFQNIECSAYCTTTNIVVRVTNWTATTPTIYYALQLLARE